MPTNNNNNKKRADYFMEYKHLTEKIQCEIGIFVVDGKVVMISIDRRVKCAQHTKQKQKTHKNRVRKLERVKTSPVLSRTQS